MVRCPTSGSIENVIESCRGRVYASTSHSPLTSESASEPPRQPLELPSNPPRSSALSPGKCASILVQRCPACFRGTGFERPLMEAAVISMMAISTIDTEDQPAIVRPSTIQSTFLNSEEVDSMGEHIQKQRKKPARAYRRIVSDEALSIHAKHPMKQLMVTNRKLRWKVTGIMALICRHDIPLFFANIDPPGEQQKFALALVRHLFMLLPSNATVVGFYDIGTVRTVSKVSSDSSPQMPLL